MSMLSRSVRAVASSSRPLLAKRALHASRPTREHFLDATPEVFEKRVMDSKAAKPILVDFYASWCQPCRVLTPLLKNATGPESGADLLTLDVDAHPELAAKYQISSLPTVIAFKNGEKVNRFIGFRPEADVKKFIEMVK